MSRKSRPTTGMCGYCGDTTILTRDHVIPECLFIKPLPTNMITIYACEPCNNQKSRDDDFLRDLLVADIQAYGHPIAMQLFEQKLRKSARRGSSEVAIRAQDARIIQTYSPSGIYTGPAYEMRFPLERIIKIFSTLAKGLYYNFHRQRLQEDTKLNVNRILTPESVIPDAQIFRKMGGQYVKLGNVFECVHIAADESCIWYLLFYNRVLFTVDSTIHSLT